jgi:uncharacterized protein
MGKKKKGITRVVLDTNVLISALLFKGRVSGFVALWQQGRLAPLLSKETFRELRKVLTYPRFALNQEEIRAILEEEVLPFFEIVDPVEPIEGVCTDPDDDPFIACAVSGGAEFVVTGDAQLVGLRRYRTVRFVTPSEFLRRVASRD